MLGKPPVTQKTLGQSSLPSECARTHGMKLPKDFLTSATCTYNVQVLVEVCAYSFKGGRKLLVEIETDQDL